MVKVLLLLFAAAPPLDQRVRGALKCNGEPLLCSRTGVSRPIRLAFTVEVRAENGTSIFAGLSQKTSDRGVDAVVEYSVKTDGSLVERGCNDETRLGSLDALRPGGPLAITSLCDGKWRQTLPRPVPPDPTMNWGDETWWARVIEDRAPTPTRDQECKAVGVRSVVPHDGGFTIAAIQICEGGGEPALLLFEANQQHEFVSVRCESDLPTDGLHVRELRRAPIAQSPQSLSFVDRCRDTAMTREVVTYRLAADGTLWRLGVAREKKEPTSP